MLYRKSVSSNNAAHRSNITYTSTPKARLTLLERFRTSRRFRQEVFVTIFLASCVVGTFILPNYLISFFRGPDRLLEAEIPYSLTNDDEAQSSAPIGSSNPGGRVSREGPERVSRASAPGSLRTGSQKTSGTSTSPLREGGGPMILASGSGSGGTSAVTPSNRTRTREKKPPRPLTSNTPVEDLPPLEGSPKDLPETVKLDDLILHRGNVARLGFKTLLPHHLPQNRMAIMKGFRGQSCAVVGNSGNLLGTRLGEAIEAHDVVVRVNSAPTAGFGADVGNRTDLRMLGRSFTHRYSLAGSAGVTDVATLPLEWGSTLVVSGTREDEYNSLVDALQEKWRRLDVLLLYLTPKLVSLTKKTLGDYRRHLLEDSFVLATRGSTPSSGFVATYLLMLICRSVTVYGFGLTDHKGKMVKYRYFDKDEVGPSGRVKRNPGLARSAIDVEFSFLRTLDAKGYINLCMGEGHGCILGEGPVSRENGEEVTRSTRWGNSIIDNKPVPKSIDQFDEEEPLDEEQMDDQSSANSEGASIGLRKEDDGGSVELGDGANEDEDFEKIGDEETKEDNEDEDEDEDEEGGAKRVAVKPYNVAEKKEEEVVSEGWSAELDNDAGENDEEEEEEE